MGKPILVPSCVAKPPLCFSMAYVLKGKEKDALGSLVKGYTLNVSQGLLKIHLPSSAFLACADGKKRAKSLFEIEDSQQVTLKEMQRYMDLIVEFYRLSPEGSFSAHVSSRARFFLFCACGLAHMQGEFTIHFLCSVFELMDEDADHLLSHRQTRRDQKRWCLDEPSLYVCMRNFSFHSSCCLALRKPTIYMGSYPVQEGIGGKPYSDRQRQRHDQRMFMCERAH